MFTPALVHALECLFCRKHFYCLVDVTAVLPFAEEKAHKSDVML